MSTSDTSGTLPLFPSMDADTSRILQGLRHQFETEKHRIVFWHDTDQEFLETVGELDLENITLLRLDQTPALAVKQRLECTDTTGRYLLYAPFAEPAPEDDWLLGMRLYSGTFRADRASIQLAELGLGQSQVLREHLRQRSKFLASKERFARLTRLVQPGDDSTALDRKMLAVLLRADQAEPFVLLSVLFHDLASQNDSLAALPAIWEEVGKYGLDIPFWKLVEQSFGYKEDDPQLRRLLIRLLVTDFKHTLEGPLPVGLMHHTLPLAATHNVAVFLNQWRDSQSRGSSYDTLSEAVAATLQLDDHLVGLSAEALVGSFTYQGVEKRIATELRDQIVAATDILDTEAIRAVAARRLDGHWASESLPSLPTVPRRSFQALYTALVAAADLHQALRSYQGGFSFPNAPAMYRAYERELYRFDQLYRHFLEAAQVVHATGWDILKSLQERVEAQYAQGYLTPLGLTWGSFVESDLLTDWHLPDIANQQHFYSRAVAPVLEKGDIKRVFVIISDAFRYEAAQELAQVLNGRFRFRAELSSQLGVLPSYTALGMAALLPHTKLSYTPKGDVLADDKSTSGLDNRDSLLQRVGGAAIHADTLLAMKKDEGRAFIRDRRVIYIYHNKIDAIGDSASTEEGTFVAVRQAIEELTNLTRHVINSLNGSYVLITADHGFLFQSTAPTLLDRSELGEKPLETVVAKKRYLIGAQLPQASHVYTGRTETTAGATGMEFWLPKGINRFHFTGGARFVHGGAMLQEIVVPLLTVRELEGAAADTTKTRSVSVHVLGNNLKATNHRFRVNLIQTEVVTERVKPVTLQIAIYAGDTPISSVETLTFESRSESIEERKKSVLLTLRAQRYDRTTPYHLILRGADDNIEMSRTEVTIDLAFDNDF
jgi:uncharacterized protein (TIGR02687 family)